MLRKKALLFFLLITSVCVYGTIDTRIEIIHKNVKEVFKDDNKDLKYDEGDNVYITFTVPSLTKRNDNMTLSLFKGGKPNILLKKSNNGLLDFPIVLTDFYNDGTLVCDIETQEKETKQLKVHLLMNLSEIQKNKQYSGNLFKIILIGLGVFIVTSILFMVTVAIYSKFKQKTRTNTQSYPVYEEMIPMQKSNENPIEENDTKLDIQNDTITVPNVYV